jgi:hypothetical protein
MYVRSGVAVYVSVGVSGSPYRNETGWLVSCRPSRTRKLVLSRAKLCCESGRSVIRPTQHNTNTETRRNYHQPLARSLGAFRTRSPRMEQEIDWER